MVGNAGMNTLALAEELGLADQVRGISYSHPSAKNRMLMVSCNAGFDWFHICPLLPVDTRMQLCKFSYLVFFSMNFLKIEK